jgi:hypothetical protein
VHYPYIARPASLLLLTTLRGTTSTTKYSRFTKDSDHLRRVRSGGNTTNFRLELSFEGGAELFDALDGIGCISGGGGTFSRGGGGHLHEISVVFSSETIAIAIEDQDGVDLWVVGGGGGGGGHGEG